MIKNTALTETHKALGAKMAPFAGYMMPIQYEGVIIEHQTVRNDVGVFDISHMGEILIQGKNALPLIQKISSNDASKLINGKAQYTYMPNYDGGIVDDLIIYRIKEEQYLLVVNASNIEKDWNWIISHNDKDKAELKNLSDEYSLLAIQGPKAIEAMQSLTSVNLAAIPYYHFEIADFAEIPHVIISATGYTGSGGFEIYCKNSEVVQVWEKVMAAGTRFGIKPIGLAARDTLRLEMGYCLYGNDITAQTSPIAAGLGWVTKFTKDFVNVKQIKEEKKTGTAKKLIGFELTSRGIPRQGYQIVDPQGTPIGEVTSGTMSPLLNTGIGMGYVLTQWAAEGTMINIKIRNRTIAAKVIKLPFYKK